jgi:hypothetical protein
MVSSFDTAAYLTAEQLAERIRAEFGMIVGEPAAQVKTTERVATHPAETLTTKALVERIHADYGVKIDQRTVTSWCSRSDNPLPTTGPVLRGQTRRFDWATARAWVEWELARPGGLSLDHIKGLGDQETRIRMRHRWLRTRGLPPPLEGCSWAPEWRP